MEKLSTRLIGVSRGVCASCGTETRLEIVESRRRRGVSDLLLRDFDDAVLRTARCLHCHTTYPVRATDSTAVEAGQRRTATRGRDWIYPTAA